IAATTFAAVWTTDSTTFPRAVTFDQTASGFSTFRQHIAATGVAPAQTLIVCEATGSYWVTFAVSMHQAGYHISVINPAQLLPFARSLPRRAKTDALDAHLCTRFAVERQPPCWTPPQVYHELHQRLATRDSLLTMRQQARNQRHALQQWPVVIASALEQLDAVIADMETRVTTLTEEIASVLRDGAWAESALLLDSIPGVGVITTAWLLVGTLNFTVATSPEQCSAYVGLAPLAYESGTSVRGRARLRHGGHARLRTALYMATLSAAQHNPAIHRFYHRLRTAGKPKKVARCAAARKLLHIAWAVVTKRQPFVATYDQLEELSTT
ncbi:MAG: IS110 family transposase, partial [Chloroflexota bacterium]|nr:IS110 family transposase [Chloroflexota bacterium]